MFEVGKARKEVKRYGHRTNHWNADYGCRDGRSWLVDGVRVAEEIREAKGLCPHCQTERR